MKELVYDPSDGEMTIACFVSGSGTNYERIFERDPDKKYVVCSNVSGCKGVEKAVIHGNPIAVLDSRKYFWDRFESVNVPRKGPERDEFDQKLCEYMEAPINGQPHLICLAGYDLWISDWMVDKYQPRILNVHPGDITKGYIGLGWVPSAYAILAGEDSVRSTVFFVDKGDDTGPILVQSKPVPVSQKGWEKKLFEIRDFASKQGTKTIKEFKETATNEGEYTLPESLKDISIKLQESLKVAGDWEIYPFAVHDLIANGRVALDDRTVYIDGNPMPEYGYRMDEAE